MKLKRIGLIGIVFTFAICLAFSCGSLAFAQECPSTDPVKCPFVDLCCAKLLGCLTPVKSACVPTECTVEELYGEYSEEIEMLRYFRDDVLSQTPVGQEIIELYYEMSPAIVQAMEEDEEFRKEVKEMIDGVLGLIGETE